jgi:glycosyltransferase involved in cell wall biosynthesis
MNPLVSIITPTYNRAKDLKRALQSVFGQTFTDWEVLVVDNHSIDNTDSLIKSFNDPKIKLLKVHNDGVIAKSRNLGLKYALGEYIAFLDSDDWWMPKKLEISLEYLERGADVVYHDQFWVEKVNQKIFWQKDPARNLKSPVFYDLLENGNGLPNSSVVIRKDLLDKVSGLSEDKNLVAAEDYETWLRVAKVSEKFQKIPQTLGYYWAGGGNISSPNRTLKYITALEKLYVDTIPDLDARRSIFWLNYNKGRTYFVLKDYDMAKKYLDLNRWSRAPLLISIKTCWMLLLISLFHQNKYNT